MLGSPSGWEGIDKRVDNSSVLGLVLFVEQRVAGPGRYIGVSKNLLLPLCKVGSRTDRPLLMRWDADPDRVAVTLFDMGPDGV